MNPLVFLAIALGLSLVGSLVVVGWSRWPRRSDDGISSFAREMRALAPETPISPGPRAARPPSDHARRPVPGPSVRPLAPPEE